MKIISNNNLKMRIKLKKVNIFIFLESILLSEDFGSAFSHED